MIEGLLICVVGMAVVFVVLTILMFMIMGMGRLTSDKGVVGGLVVEELVAGKEEVKAEDTAEVAAIALALASYLKEQGKALGKPIAISGVQYQVEMGDLSYSPVSLMINQDSYRAAVGDEGLPVTEQVSPKFVAQAKGIQSGLGWRSAYHQLQGKYWSRGGWTGRRS
jgi:sodium pump decarboxylase gamma subunit